MPVIGAVTFKMPDPIRASKVMVERSFELTPQSCVYAPYQYVATISSPYNWTLKTDATLHMSDGNIANDTAPPPQQPAKQIIPPTQNYVNYLESISGILLLIGLLAIFMVGCIC